MSPIDDELRALLSDRAAAVTPAPDPLGGIERRARRMRRSRVAASVAGSALVVAAVAVAVPSLQSRSTAPRPPQVATSDKPSPAVSYALDPERPWAFRGKPVDEGTRAAIQREYATRARGAEVLVTPLFAQVYEPSGQLEVVFLAGVDDTYRWAVATTTESGPEFVWDEPLAPGQQVLAAALPGDEQARLLVVAAPEAVSIDYGPDGASEYNAMAELAPGVAVVALSGDTANDGYRVRFPEGVVTAPAPDGEQPPTAEPAVDNFGLTATFVSPTYGYSFGHIYRAVLEPATERWDPGNQPIDDLNRDPRFDGVETGAAAYLEAASTPVPKGVPIDEWVDEHVTPRAAGGCGIPRSQHARITVDGQPGRVATCANRIEATVVAGGRLYLFILGHERADPRAMFDAWMATVELTPDTAVR